MLKVAGMLCEVATLGFWSLQPPGLNWIALLLARYSGCATAASCDRPRQHCLLDACAGVGTRTACLVSSNYSYPPCTLTDEETRTEMINRELQISQREKQEILAFEGHLAAASTKQTITESSSLLLSQLTSLDPQYAHPPRPIPRCGWKGGGEQTELSLSYLLCPSMVWSAGCWG